MRVEVMMTLREIVESLDSWNSDQTIFVDPAGGVRPESRAVVTWAPDEDTGLPDAPGMNCFLDVWHAKEVIENKARLHGLSRPTTDERVALLVEYARTGA